MLAKTNPKNKEENRRDRNQRVLLRIFIAISGEESGQALSFQVMTLLMMLVTDLASTLRNLGTRP